MSQVVYLWAWDAANNVPRRVAVNASGHLIILNSDKLDVPLSTRLADNKFPAAAALSDNISNPTTTLVGAPLLGWDAAGMVWRRLQCDTSGRLKVCF